MNNLFINLKDIYKYKIKLVINNQFRNNYISYFI